MFVVEGEKDVLAVEALGGNAVCARMGAGQKNLHRYDWSVLKGRRAIVVRDKDNAGREYADRVAEILEPVASLVQTVEAAVGKDAADHIAADRGLDEFVDVPSELLDGLMTAAVLDGMSFAPLAQHVPQLITEGFGVLAGAPKVGKSWLVASIALASALGGFALNGIRVQSRAVLLLALEDGTRRLQSRMRRLNGEEPLPAKLDVLTKVKPGTAAATISAWLKLHRHDEDPPLVILDTLGKARPQRRPGDDPYIADYQFGSKLKEVVDVLPGSALVAVHHTRKMGAADWLETVAGTQGITGSADYVLVLARKRKSDEGLLSVTGRDVSENEYALWVDNGLWRFDGGHLDVAASRADDRQEKNRLGDRALDVLALVNRRVDTHAADVAQELGVAQDQARVYLSRLAASGRIKKLGRGAYAPVSYVPTVTEDQGNATDITQQTDHPTRDSVGVACCVQCGDALLHPDSLVRGYCAKPECLRESGA